jgi:sugar transferase EpsL
MKRILDLCLSTSALILLSPVFIVVSLAIFSNMGAPLIFRQERPGRHGRLFTLFKFRTMTAAQDTRDELRTDGARLTNLGLFLRRLSLDELPQLWNVWIGDMSIVGPRPLLVQYLSRYSSEQARRHEVKPGITGWAQVNGRNAISWDDKFRLDTWYVENASFLFDARIIAMTLRNLMHRTDVSQSGFATMPEFVGDTPRPTTVIHQVTEHPVPHK